MLPYQLSMRFKMLNRVMLILTISVLLASCASPAGKSTNFPETSTATPDQGTKIDVLRILNPQAPEILNPHLSSAIKDWEPSRITYEPLATFDMNGNLVAFLAEEIPSLDNGGVAADGKSVTWKLKQDVYWSDGKPFTAEDVYFTYQFISNPETKAVSAVTYNNVQSVDVLDPHTVRISFKGVTPAWAVPFVGIQGVILPKHMFESYNGENARQAPANILPVGTGPYRVVSPGIKPQEILLLGTQLVKTNKIVFEPNPYFREPYKVYFSKIEMRGGGTPEEAARMIKNGELDYAYDVGQLPVSDLAEMAEQGLLVSNFGSNVYRIMLNHTDPNKETDEGERSSLDYPHPFFSDLRVRQAFAYAIDRDALASFYGPAGQATTNVLVAPPQYNSPNTYYAYDPEQAKALLDEAGWVDTNSDGVRDKDGVKMKVVFQAQTGAALEQAQRMVKQNLEAVGIEVELKIVDPSIMFGPCASNPDSAWCFNADMQYIWIKSATPDPTSYMEIWTCSGIPQKSNDWTGINFERWCNTEYEDLFQKSKTELDPEKRAQLFIQMNDLLVKEVVMIPTVFFADVQGVSITITGISPTPWDANTWNIMEWRRNSP